MLGFASASGDHRIVPAPDMAPRSVIRRLAALLRAIVEFFKHPDRSDEMEKAGFLARLRRKWLFQRFAGYFQEHHGAIFLVWNGTKGVRKIAAAAAKSVGTKVVYMELAPMPKRITIDSEGVNHGSGFPRDPRFFHAWRAQVGSDDAWRAARDEITARDLRRAVGAASDAVDADALPKRYIFCPLQVPGDSQITHYGGWIASVEQLIAEIARAAAHVPKGWGVVVKQHPSSPLDLRAAGHFDGTGLINGDEIPTIELIRGASLIVTVNSSVGLEAALFDKPVTILGKAVYGIDGFCEVAPDVDALHRVFAHPGSVTFDHSLRAAVMGYMRSEYYYEEAAVTAGAVSLDTIETRDARAAQIWASV